MLISTYTSVAGPYVVSPAWLATSVHTPVLPRLFTRKVFAGVIAVTVHIDVVREVIVTVSPVAVLSERLSEVAVKV